MQHGLPSRGRGRGRPPGSGSSSNTNTVAPSALSHELFALGSPPPQELKALVSVTFLLCFMSVEKDLQHGHVETCKVSLNRCIDFSLLSSSLQISEFHCAEARTERKQRNSCCSCQRGVEGQQGSLFLSVALVYPLTWFLPCWCLVIPVYRWCARWYVLNNCWCCM